MDNINLIPQQSLLFLLCPGTKVGFIFQISLLLNYFIILSQQEGKREEGKGNRERGERGRKKKDRPGLLLSVKALASHVQGSSFEHHYREIKKEGRWGEREESYSGV